jgi:hypothetical protein
MKKDAFYFPHFANARRDPKIRRLIKDHGLSGYAVYFMLLEILREQTNFSYPLEDVDLLADEMKVKVQVVMSVIQSYDLFQTESDGNFFSKNQIKFMLPYLEKAKRAKEAAEKRWNHEKNNFSQKGLQNENQRF